MRSSNKSRSRNKNQNRRSSTNVINRVFDSSGPDSKVRGTPQQIIEKYQMLARDAQLSGDRVAAENFQQHSEHYTRLLSEAQHELNQRREAQEAQQAQRREVQQNDENLRQPDQQPSAQPEPVEPAPPLAVEGGPETGLVETPEGKNSGGRKKKQQPEQAAQ